MPIGSRIPSSSRCLALLKGVDISEAQCELYFGFTSVIDMCLGFLTFI